MNEVYSVGVTLKLHDLISTELSNVSRAMFRIDELARLVNKQFDALGKQTSHFRSLAQSASSLSKNMDKASNETFRLDRAMESLRANGGLSAVGLGAERNLAAANIEAKTLLTTLREIRAAGNLPTPSGGGSRPGHSGGLHGGAIHAGTNGVGVGSVGLGLGESGAAIGGAAIAAGGIAYGAKTLAEAAGAYEFQKARFTLFGMSKEQNEAAFKFAESQHIMGASKTDIMKYMVEAQGAFRESGKSGEEALTGAKIAAPLLAKIHYASMLSGHEMTEKQELDMLRYAEQRGGTTNPARFAQLVEDAFKTNITSGGQVNFSELRQYMRTSQGASMNETDEALLGYYEPLMGELKGGPMGTAFATANKRIMGITRATKTQLDSIRAAGIWDMSKVVFNSKGGIDHFKGDGIPLKHADEWSHNKVKYYFDYVLPTHIKAGYNQAQISKHNADIFGGTGGALMDKAGQQRELIEEGLKARALLPSLEQIQKATDGTLTGAEHDFTAAWSDFKTEFGKNVLPQFTTLIKQGTELLRKMSTPEMSKVIEPTALSLLPTGPSTGIGTPIKAVLRWLHEKSGAVPKPGQTVPDVTFPAPGASVGIAPRNYLPPSAGTSHAINNTIVMPNGEVLARVVTKVQAKEMSRPQTGSRFTDPTLGLPPVSASMLER